MTEEEILAMEAGNKLNLLVCEKVFNNKTFGSVKPYSTDISAAWEVVEYLGGIWDIKIRLRPHPDDPPFAEGRPAYQAAVSLADYVEAEGIHINQREGKSPWCWQLPEAICLAALLVKLATAEAV